AFEHEGDRVRGVIGLDSDDVVVTSAFEHLGHAVEVHAQGEVPITAIVLEPFGSEEEGEAGVHGLEREAGGGAVEVGIVDEVLERFQNLLQKTALDQPQLQHFRISETQTEKEEQILTAKKREEDSSEWL
ncbi:hypothetical protein PanWU01x14_329400, partial [Parasponia andersonii]